MPTSLRKNIFDQSMSRLIDSLKTISTKINCLTVNIRLNKINGSYSSKLDQTYKHICFVSASISYIDNNHQIHFRFCIFVVRQIIVSCIFFVIQVILLEEMVSRKEEFRKNLIINLNQT